MLALQLFANASATFVERYDFHVVRVLLVVVQFSGHRDDAGGLVDSKVVESPLLYSVNQLRVDPAVGVRRGHLLHYSSWKVERGQLPIKLH